jgi:Zn-finger nucleic acid-binding protein
MSGCAACNGTFVGFAQLEELMQSAPRTGQSSGPCPNCGEALDHSVVWLRCIVCQGSFIDFDRLQQLVAALDLGDVTTQITRVAVAPVQRQQLRCPHCRLAMPQHLFFHQAVDVCVAHGVWFDVSELQNAAAKMQQLLLQMQIRRLM